MDLTMGSAGFGWKRGTGTYPQLMAAVTVPAASRQT